MLSVKLVLFLVARKFASEFGIQRLSIGDAMRSVLTNRRQSELAAHMLSYLHQGLAVPDNLAVQCLEVALMNLVCSTRGYLSLCYLLFTHALQPG